MDDLPPLEHERSETDVCLRQEREKTDTELARRASQRELETFAAALLLGTERKKTDEKLGHERKRTDELFREQGQKHRVLHTASESTLRLFVESVQDYALFLLDPTGHIMSWNAGAQRLKGYTAERAIGRHFSIFYSEDDRKAGKPEEQLRIAAAEGRSVANGWRVREDGSRFEAHVVITALRDDAGVLKGFGKVTRDVSEFEALRRADRTKDEFLAFVSHDLKNPLWVVDMTARMLENAKDAAVKKAGQRIQRASERMARLVRDLLDVASVQAGQLRVETRPCDAGQLVRDALEALGPLAAEKGLWIEAKPCPPGIFVRCDAGRIQQVFSNLVGNAIKYSPRGTNVTVTAEPQSDHVRFSVADAGPGVPTDQLGRIFERFWRHDGREESHGLGLYITKGIVEAHGGRIWVESMVGVGSTFTFTIPRVK